MKRFFYIAIIPIILIFCYSCKTTEKKPQAKLVDETLILGKIKVQLYEFPNNFRVAISENRRAPVFTYRLIYGAGSRLEEGGETGMSHMLEHLMFKGTKKYPPGSMDRIIKELGAENFNASTSRDFTRYKISLPSKHLEEIIKIDSDRMKNLVLDKKMLEIEKQIVLSERKTTLVDNATGKIYSELYRLAFQKHPYGRPIIGIAQDIRNYSLEEIYKYYHKYYSPNNALLVIAGDVNTNNVLTLVEEYFGKIKASEIPVKSYKPEPPQGRERIKKLWIDINKIQILMAYHIPKVTDDDFPAIDLLDNILSSGKKSLLKKELYDKGIASSDSWLSLSVDPSLFHINTTVLQTEKWRKAIRVIDDIFSRIRKDGIDEDTVKRNMNIYTTSYYSYLETNGGIASIVGDSITYEGQLKKINEYWEKLQKVTGKDIKRVVTKYFIPQNRTMIIAMPRKMR